MNIADLEARPVLVPAVNKEGPVRAKKPPLKPLRKVEKAAEVVTSEEKKASIPASTAAAVVASSPRPSSPTMPLRRQGHLLCSNLSFNASCSPDASSESLRNGASRKRIIRSNSALLRKQCAWKVEKVVADSISVFPQDSLQLKRRCAWVRSNTDQCYAAFHDEEWGVPVHDDKKLFELLALSGALAEHTWPAILSRRHLLREVFVDFDPTSVANLNEKKIIAPASTARSLLSEPKLRAVIENARQISKIIDEFGSFHKYCWSFVNHKPVVSRFRYPHQVPVKAPKADVISKDLVRRGFRCVGPTVIYSFMQAAGMTNDHLISCYRFEECNAAAARDEVAVKAKADNDEMNNFCLEKAFASWRMSQN